MKYLIAILSNRLKAEDAYSALQQAQLDITQLSILGDGHKSADEFGLTDPNQQALKQSQKLAYWVIPFGFVAGYIFNLLTHIEIISVLSPLGNHLIGGLLGAVSGAIGALLAGGAVGWIVGSKDALIYRNRLNAGKYLVIVEGNRNAIEQATNILEQFTPENIQGYNEPVKA